MANPPESLATWPSLRRRDVVAGVIVGLASIALVGIVILVAGLDNIR